MILLRPELFEFAEPQSVCRLSCTCKTLRSDVRDAKPWGLLARAQLQPPQPRDAAAALAVDAEWRVTFCEKGLIDAFLLFDLSLVQR